MSSELLELVGFLHSPQPAVRQIALESLMGYSTGPQAHIFRTNDYQAVTDLKVLMREESQTTVRQATTVLVNLCDDQHVLEMLVGDLEFVKFVACSIMNLNNRHADLMAILLSNLAKNDEIVKLLEFTWEVSDSKVFASNKVMDGLMDCFVKGADRSLNKYADFDYLAYFFADISRFREGRSYFVTEQEYDGIVPFSKLLVFTEKYDSRIRREGVAYTIKNSVFDVEAHKYFLNDEKINFLPYILLPLTKGTYHFDDEEEFALPEELQLLPEDKQREPLPQILATHVETLILLCTTRSGREYLREKGVYPVIRELHKSIDDPDVLEKCERLVQLLMRDEAPENGEEDKVKGGADEEDDEDNVIEEVV